MFLLQVPAASDSDSEGDELVQQYLADSGDSDEDTLQGLPQWEQPEGGESCCQTVYLSCSGCTEARAIMYLHLKQPLARLKQISCTAASSFQTTRQPSFRPTNTLVTCFTSRSLLSVVAVPLAQHLC